MNTIHTKVEAYQRLAGLHGIREQMLQQPEGYVAGAYDWVCNDIAELEALLFRQNEKAAGQGDLIIIALENHLSPSITLKQQLDKEVRAGA
ncbi:hypothetical protein [Paenibacillus sp. YYML68]|uniref:hypothetical protein n=1 Tax=Paenibacillus sp. YYML68 TaxID=2909250 RepID=UPI002490E189|nr:hypothetical protein [Paenibacillus sp. YYML68]